MGSTHQNKKPPVVVTVLISMLLVSCASSDVGQHRPFNPQASVEPIALSAVNVARQPDGMQVVITGARPFAYTISSDDEPPRIIVNIPGAHFVGVPPRLAVEQGGIKTLELGHLQDNGVTARLLIHLEKPIPYRVVTKRASLLVSISPSAPAASLPAPPAAPRRQSVSVSPPTSTDQDYRVGAKDVLAITVYDEPDLSNNFRVSGDGFISFPLLGKVQVNGLTASEIETLLQQRLSQGYLINPQVSLAIAEYHSQQVLVLGAVRNPGQFPLRGNTTLLEMISRAGGLDQRAGKSNALVLIRETVTPDAAGGAPRRDVTTTRIDLDRFLNQGDMKLNVPVQGRDVIYVPPPAAVFVIGEVKQPGPISLSKNLTLVEAISKAGGFTRIASPSRSRVIRVVNGVEQTLRVNVTDIIKRGDRHQDMILEPGDIVVVPESFF